MQWCAIPQTFQCRYIWWPLYRRCEFTKVCLVISQAMKPPLSKFYGIRFIGGLKKSGKIIFTARGNCMAGGIAVFAIVPAPLQYHFSFHQRVPAGHDLGIVFLTWKAGKPPTLSGRCWQFYLSSGFVKSVAKYLMLTWNINEFWVPFITGLVFIIPLVLLLYLLEKFCTCSWDIAARKERLPMTGTDKKMVLLFYWGW